MLERLPAGNGLKDPGGYPLTVLPPGTVLNGHYQIDGFHKLGGMSVTYKARQGQRQLLIKEVESGESKSVISLNQERCTLDRLEHPGIVRAHDLFEEKGHYYLVLDFVEGQSLDTLVSPFPDTFLQEEVVLDWALQLCDIFEYLHGQNPPVIYRDLKPKNVIKGKDGKLILVDFGIARIFKDNKSRDTEPMGSAVTASPEHYGMSQTDSRSDIYTLGATLHYLLSNGRGPDEPFRFKPLRDLNPELSQKIERVIAKAVQPKPEERYQSIGEMRQALLNTREEPLPTEEPLGPQGSPAKGRPQPAEPTPTSSPPPYLAWGLVGLLALLLVLSLFRGPGTPEPVATATTVAVMVHPTPKLPEPEMTPEPVVLTPEPQPRITPEPPPMPRETPAPVAVQPPPPQLPPPSYPKATPRPRPSPTRDYPEAGAESSRPIKVERQLYSLAAPGGYRKVSDEPARLYFEAQNPRRSLEVTLRPVPPRSRLQLAKQYRALLKKSGAQNLKLQEVTGGESPSLKATFDRGSARAAQYVTSLGQTRFVLALEFEAEKEHFNAHLGDFDFLKNSLKIKSPSRDWSERREGRWRGGRRLR